jgi:hypothetical protein
MDDEKKIKKFLEGQGIFIFSIIPDRLWSPGSFVFSCYRIPFLGLSGQAMMLTFTSFLCRRRLRRSGAIPLLLYAWTGTALTFIYVYIYIYIKFEAEFCCYLFYPTLFC